MNLRSTNGQLQWIINEALRKSGRLKKTKIKLIQKKNNMFTINLGPFSGKTLLKYIIIHLSQIGY